MSVDLETHQIRSRAEFDGIKAAKAGVIINKDAGDRKLTAHKPWCAYPSGADFERKVIENRGKRGGYFYFLRLEDAEAALGEVHRHACN